MRRVVGGLYGLLVVVFSLFCALVFITKFTRPLTMLPLVLIYGLGASICARSSRDAFSRAKLSHAPRRSN